MPPPIDIQNDPADVQRNPADVQRDPVYQAMTRRQPLLTTIIEHDPSPGLNLNPIDMISILASKISPGGTLLPPGAPGNPTNDYIRVGQTIDPWVEATKAYNQMLAEQNRYRLGAADVGIRQQAENRLAELGRGQLANETARTQWQTSMHPAIQQLAQAGVNLAAMSPEDRARLAHSLGDFSTELQRAMPVGGVAAPALRGQPPAAAGVSQPTTPQGPSAAVAPLYDKAFEDITGLMSAYKTDPFTALMQARAKNPQYFEENRQRLVDYALSHDRENLNRLRQGVFRTGYRQLFDVLRRPFSSVWGRSPEEEFADYMRQAYGYGRSPMGIENVGNAVMNAANTVVSGMTGGR